MCLCLGGALANTPCMKINCMLQWKLRSWIHHIESFVGGLELLRIVGQTAANIQAGSSMGTGGDCSGTYRAVVSSAGAAADCFYPGSGVLAVGHPVVEHHWLGCRYVHDHHAVLLCSSVLAWNLRNHQDINWLPWSKPDRVIVCRRVLLSEDVAWHSLGRLKRYRILQISPTHTFLGY